jgi:hypothetical protein
MLKQTFMKQFIPRFFNNLNEYGTQFNALPAPLLEQAWIFIPFLAS